MIEDILDATFIILYEKNDKIIPSSLSGYLWSKGLNIENHNPITILERIVEIRFADKLDNLSSSHSHMTPMFFYRINLNGIHFIENLPNDFSNRPYSYYQANVNKSIPKVKWQRYKKNPVTQDWDEDIIEEYSLGYTPKDSFEYKYIRVDYLEDLEKDKTHSVTTTPKINESSEIKTLWYKSTLFKSLIYPLLVGILLYLISKLF